MTYAQLIVDLSQSIALVLISLVQLFSLRR